MAQKEIELNGTLKDRLIEGSKIIWFKYDGFDWHVVIENKKGHGMRFEKHETSMFSSGSNKFKFKTGYNNPKIDVLKKVYSEFMSDSFRKEKRDKYIKSKKRIAEKYRFI